MLQFKPKFLGNNFFAVFFIFCKNHDNKTFTNNLVYSVILYETNVAELTPWLINLISEMEVCMESLAVDPDQLFHRIHQDF